MKTIAERINEYKGTWPIKYYDFFQSDFAIWPDAEVFLCISARGKGKTYSVLLHALENKQKIVYVKRTNEDIAFICGDISNASPYAPINRDTGYEIVGKKLTDGIGAFYHANMDGKPSGVPVSYAFSLNAIKKSKGVELSECDFLVFDEFIPQIGERFMKGEGEAFLDLQMTINRDRELRGKEPVKVVLLANAEEISTPVTNTLDVVDILAEMQFDGQEYAVLEDRGILLHRITENECPTKEEQKKGLYKVMQGTPWFRKSFLGEFSKNDFSMVARDNLKGFRCIACVRHFGKEIYVYEKNKKFYLSRSKGSAARKYDLERDKDQAKFYIDIVYLLKECIVEGLVSFEKYSMYDLIANYKKFYKA